MQHTPQFRRTTALIAALLGGAPAAATIVPGLATVPAATRVFTVDSAATLQQAMAIATPGSRIELKSGIYGPLAWRNFRNTGQPVTITSAAGHLARFASADLTGSSGIILHRLEFVGAFNPLINFTQASDILMTGTLISGATRNSDPWDDTNTGVWIRSASRITLSGNWFTDLRAGVYVQRSSTVALAENDLKHIREGFNITAVAGIWLHRNLFQQFSPRYQDQEHPDAIQFWTTREVVGNSDILITENFMNFGGKRPVQGIFMRSEEAESRGHSHIKNRNVRVIGNVYYGSSRHGISLSSVVNGVVRNNSVLASPWADRNEAGGISDAGRSGGGLQPAIMLRFPENVRVERNAAPLLLATEPGGTFADNLDVWDTLQRKEISAHDVYATPPTGDLPAVSAFAVRSPSIAHTRSIGAVSLPRPGPQVAYGHMVARGGWYHARSASIASLVP